MATAPSQEGTRGPAHAPLSARLAGLLEQEAGASRLTLNRLLERTEGHGVFLIIILLCVPFLAPATIPGTSIPFGLAIAWLSLAAARDHPPRLPRLLGDRPLPPALKKLLAGGGLRFLRWVERYAKPRRTAWLHQSWARWGNALLMAFWGLVLALPLPPIPPLGNTLPSYAILLLGASLMEGDGVLIWWAYGLSLFNLLYFALWAEVLIAIFQKWGHYLGHWPGLAA